MVHVSFYRNCKLLYFLLIEINMHTLYTHVCSDFCASCDYVFPLPFCMYCEFLLLIFPISVRRCWIWLLRVRERERCMWMNDYVARLSEDFPFFVENVISVAAILQDRLN